MAQLAAPPRVSFVYYNIEFIEFLTKYLMF